MGWARQAGVDLLEDDRARRAPGRRRCARRRSPRCPITPFPPGRIRGSACRWRSRCTSSSGRSAWRAWATTAIRSLELAPRALRGPARRRPGRFDSYLHEAGEPAAVRTAHARRPLLVGAAGDGPVAARRRAAVGARATCCSRTRAWRSSATRRRYASLECGRLRRRARPSRPAQPHAPRRRPPLAAPIPGPGRTSTSGPVLVPLDPGAQRAPARRPLAAARRRASAKLRRPAGDGEWCWVRGRFGDLTRTLVAGPYLLDVVELGGAEEHAAGAALASRRPGRGGDAGRVDRRPARRPVRRAGRSASPAPRIERRRPPRAGRATAPCLTLHLRFDGELLRASVPGPARTAGARRHSICVREGSRTPGWSRRSRARAARRRCAACACPARSSRWRRRRHRPPRGRRRRAGRSTRRRDACGSAGLRRRPS